MRVLPLNALSWLGGVRVCVRHAGVAVVLSTVLALCFVSPATAQEDSAEQTQMARQLFEEGLAFVESEQWPQAADRFGRVLAIRGSAIVSYNYASALAKLGRFVDASRALRGVVADPSASPEVVTAARTLLSDVEPRVGQLSIRLRGDTTRVQVMLDDDALPPDSVGTPIAVDPGEHVVIAMRDGLSLARRTVVVAEGSPLINITIDVAPTASAAASSVATGASEAPTSSTSATTDGGGSSALWWIVGGSVVAVGAAVVIGLLVANPSEPDPVLGNTDPAVLRGRVGAVMP